MTIFSFIDLGLAALLLLLSGVCYVVYLANRQGDWRRLALKVFRFSMLLVLLWINVILFGNLISQLL